MAEQHNNPALAGRPIVQWFVFLAGPLAWVAQLLVNYFLVAVICGVASRGIVEFLLHLTSIAALTVTLTAGALAFSMFRRGPSAAPASLDEPDEPPIFMGAAGSLTNLLFLIVISLSWLGIFLISPCT